MAVLIILTNHGEEDNDCIYMQEHNRVMNVTNEDGIHVNRIIRSASLNGSD